MKFLGLALAVYGLVEQTDAATVKRAESASGNSNSYDFVSLPLSCQTELANIGVLTNRLDHCRWRHCRSRRCITHKQRPPGHQGIGHRSRARWPSRPGNLHSRKKRFDARWEIRLELHHDTTAKCQQSRLYAESWKSAWWKFGAQPHDMGPHFGV